MNWYLAKLVFGIHYSDTGFSAEFDEQIRLVMAEDELHAVQKARLMGEKETSRQPSASCELIRWKFMDVTELHKLDKMTDGAEMFSQVSVQQNADAYIRSIRNKSLLLYNQAIEQFTVSQ